MFNRRNENRFESSNEPRKELYLSYTKETELEKKPQANPNELPSEPFHMQIKQKALLELSNLTC